MEAPVQPPQIEEIPAEPAAPTVKKEAETLKPKPSPAAAQYNIRPQAPKPASVVPSTAKPAEPQPAAKRVDVSAVAVGGNVKHRIFGEGTVVNIDKARKYITVKFNAGEKRFVLQDSFDRDFLSL